MSNSNKPLSYGVPVGAAIIAFVGEGGAGVGGEGGGRGGKGHCHVVFS